MAERRMFAKTIVLSDAFLDMPTSARCLYFTLSMFADDDGFVNSPKGIMRQAGASEDDMRVLVSKKFIITFDSGVVLIKHWKIHNYVRSDRYKPTVYTNELAQVWTDDDKKYHLVSKMDTIGIPNGYTGKCSIGQVSLGKDSVGKVSEDDDTTPPISEEIYESLVKKYGKSFVDERMKRAYNDKALEKFCEADAKRAKPQSKFNDFKQRNYNYTELEQRLLGM